MIIMYNKTMTKKEKKLAEKATKAIVKNYGETLKKLAKC